MQRITIHPDNPQPRLVKQAADAIRRGELVAYPTDTAYALASPLGNKSAMEAITRLRRLPEHHQYTLLCRDLSELGTYAKVDNGPYRLLRANTPSRITFILPATNEVPRRLMHPKKKTIGLRIPTDAFCQALLEELGEPFLTSTLQLPDQELPMDDPDEIAEQLSKQLDVLVDGGVRTRGLTTIIDLSSGQPELVRQGMEAVDELWD